MKPIAWTAVLLRIVAIWLVAGVLLALPGLVAGVAGIWSEEFGPYPEGYGMLEALILLLQAALAIFLWFLALPIAAVIWRDFEDQAAPNEVSGHDLQLAIFSAVGLYVVLAAIPDLASSLGYLHFRNTELRQDYTYPGDFGARTVGLLLQIAVGIWLLFDADRLVGKISRQGKSTPDEAAV